MKNQNKKEPNLNVLFLIGNGFDLHNSLDTSYEAFIKWYILKNINEAFEKENYMDECIEIKFNKSEANFNNYDKSTYIFDSLHKLNEIYAKQDVFFSSVNRNEIEQLINTPPYLCITSKNKFISKILTKCMKKNWSGIESEINNHIKNSYSTNEKREMGSEINNSDIQSLNRSISCLKGNLVEYLKLQNSPELSNNFFNDPNILNWGWERNITKDFITNVYFLTFNYTTYLDNIVKELKNNFSPDNTEFHPINYIHGRIDDLDDNIIFGVGDEEEEFLKNIESYYSDEWLKPIKSYDYLRNNNYQNLIGFTELGNYEIYIIGHSCSITDRTLLKMLFEDERCKRINVMHRGLPSYLKTCYNISRNFSDKIKLRKILQPFNPELSF